MGLKLPAGEASRETYDAVLRAAKDDPDLCGRGAVLGEALGQCSIDLNLCVKGRTEGSFDCEAARPRRADEGEKSRLSAPSFGGQAR